VAAVKGKEKMPGPEIPKTYRRRQRVLIILGIILFIVGVPIFFIVSAYYGMSIGFAHTQDHPYETHRYTWGYYFVIDGGGVLNNFPMILPASHRHFYYYTPSYGEGSCNGVYYLSRASQKELIKSFDAFLRSHNLAPDPEYPKDDIENGQMVRKFRYHPAHPVGNEAEITSNHDVTLTTVTNGLLKVDYSDYFTPD
jgi:hypothetical protein